MDNYNTQLIKHRRILHTIPETAFKEFKTSAYLKEFIKSLNIFEIKEYAKTGFVAAYRGGGDADFLALRADMDALPVAENTKLEFSSQHEGCMHACGHDLHMAILLTTAEYIKQSRPKKNILLVFQPAEEGLGGALEMLNEGLLTDFKVSEIFALHNICDYPVGTIALNHGKMFAGTVEFKIVLKGIGGHAAFYHNLNDLNVAASVLIMMLTSIPSRMINPNHEAIVSVGSIGSNVSHAANILPEIFTIHGTVRSFYKDDLTFIKQKINDMVAGVSLAYGIKGEVFVVSEYLPVINNPQVADKLFSLAKGCGVEVIECEQKMTGEDFGFLVDKIPGAIFWLGTANEDNSQNHSLHNSCYSPSEDGMLYGFKVLKALVDQ